MDWDNMEIRIIIAAPSFGQNVLKMAPKIGYPTQLIKIQRFVFDKDECVLVEVLEEQVGSRSGITKALATYDRECYELSHGKEAVDQFLGVVAAIEDIVREQGWNLETKFNKYYTSFKYGTRVCFGVAWNSTHQWSVFAKVPKSVADSVEVSEWRDWGYDEGWKEVH